MEKSVVKLLKEMIINEVIQIKQSGDEYSLYSVKIVYYFHLIDLSFLSNKKATVKKADTKNRSKRNNVTLHR